ncbi:MAG TPA: Clp protease N-terminal domain-containing protein [Gemmataceae bacterium]|jgi:ATP-dependent Clp protease ATP-binding subunit ClpC|nr:Clp protease N-terminal domain-containing protein [Gemmataceae bacterium]
MYERFSDRARKVMQLADQEAQRLNHEYIGTEHLLLGLVREGSGSAAIILKNCDIDLRQIRMEIEKIVQSGPDTVITGELPQTPRAKKVIEYSIKEARDLNHKAVGTEHLLLGLLREEEGVAAQVLMNMGLKLEEVREQVLNFPGQKKRPGQSASAKVVPAEVDLSGLPTETQTAVCELDAEINKLNQEKDKAVKESDFETAAMLRDRADRLRKKKQTLIAAAQLKGKDTPK